MQRKFDEYINEALNFKDIFGDEWESTKIRKVVKTDPPKTKEIILDLYRGFDADIDKLKKSGSKNILSPDKSEQQAIWFSQWLRDAKGRGQWILKYPLKAKKHYIRTHYDDGSYIDRTPEEIEKQENPLENSSIHGGVELPNGWLWSYKNEKYIISVKPILVSNDMIKRDSEYDEDSFNECVTEGIAHASGRWSDFKPSSIAHKTKSMRIFSGKRSGYDKELFETQVMTHDGWNTVQYSSSLEEAMIVKGRSPFHSDEDVRNYEKIQPWYKRAVDRGLTDKDIFY